MRFLTDNGSGAPVTEPGSGLANQLWFLEPVANSPLTMRIRNAQSRKYIQTPGDNREGSAFVMAVEGNDPGQRFRVNSISGGGIDLSQFGNPVEVYIKPVHASNMALDRPGGSLNNGARLQIWSKINNNGNQLWTIEYDPTLNSFFIKVLNTTKALEILSFSRDNAGAVGIWDKWNGENTNQRWIILPIVREAGRYLLLNWNSTKALDVYGVGTTNGSQIVQWEYVGGDNQKWIIERK